MGTIEGSGERQKAEQIPRSLLGTVRGQVGTTEGWGGEQKSGVESRKLRGCRILGRVTTGWGDGRMVRWGMIGGWAMRKTLQKGRRLKERLHCEEGRRVIEWA